MAILYVSTGANKLKVVEVDDATGNLIQIVQTIDPVVDPLPLRRDDGSPLPTKGMFVPVTEWVENHPALPLVYAFTSFWSDATAVVTTFRIVDPATGRLTRLGRVETGGYQAAHATFSPDGTRMVVSHHNSGTLSFVDVTNDGTLTAPVKTVEIPELRPETRTMRFPRCLPSLHHVGYGPNRKYLLACDVSKQGRVWTFAVDAHGVPLSDRPTSHWKPTFVTKINTWLGWTVKSALGLPEYRIRRAVVHPNGKYVYMLMEFNNVLQVYEIDAKGKIAGDCLQEIPTIDPGFFKHSYWGNDSKWTGVALNSAAELYVTESEVLVSNRGMTTRLGQGENSIRIFSIQEEGAKLVPKQMVGTAGPVRFFWKDRNCTRLYSGVNQSSPPQVIETFVRDSTSGLFTKVGEADVEMDVICIASM
jgi:6-phosphogluconolactonase (cycloisomerase 2 family)